MYVNLMRNTTRQKPANMADIPHTISIDGDTGKRITTTDDRPISPEQVDRTIRQKHTATLPLMQDLSGYMVKEQHEPPSARRQVRNTYCAPPACTG